MTTRAQQTPTSEHAPAPVRNGQPWLSPFLKNTAYVVAAPTVICALVANGWDAVMPRLAHNVITGAALLGLLLFVGLLLASASTQPTLTRDEQAAHVRATIAELQALLAQLESRNAEPGVIAEVRALAAGLTVASNDTVALGQARRRLAISATPASVGADHRGGHL